MNEEILQFIEKMGVCDEGDIVGDEDLLNDDSTQEKEREMKYGV